MAVLWASLCFEFNASSFHFVFRSHILAHLGDSPYMCKQCNKKFISPLTLASHLKKYPGDHNFACSKCKRRFPGSEKLEKHDCILENTDVFICACNNTYRKYNNTSLENCCWKVRTVLLSRTDRGTVEVFYIPKNSTKHRYCFFFFTTL